MVAASPTLAAWVATVSAADSPVQFSLWESNKSLAASGQPFGRTSFYDANGRRLPVSNLVGVTDVISEVSAIDLQSPTLVGLAAEQGRVANLNNVQVHEFGHGHQFITTGDSGSEAAVEAMVCTVADETGGRCE